MRNCALSGCIIAVFLALPAGGYTQSNPPSPSPSKIQKPEQQKSESTHKPTAPNKNGANATPNVKEAPSEDTKPKPSEHSDERGSQSSADWWMVKLTAILAAIGFLQLIVFGRQATRLTQTIEAMKKIGADQSRDMQASIAVAKESADAAMKSAFVAEQTLSGTEAPFIFIIVASTDGNAIVTVTSPQGIKYPENVSYTLNNYGRSPAIIREIYLECIASDVMPGPCHFPPLQGNLFQSEIVGPSGSSQPKPLPQIASFLPNDGKIYEWASVFVCGNVRYADVFGNQYISGFCCAFDDRSKRFYAIGGANHNYRRKLTEGENREAEEWDIIPSLNKG